MASNKFSQTGMSFACACVTYNSDMTQAIHNQGGLIYKSQPTFQQTLVCGNAPAMYLSANMFWIGMARKKKHAKWCNMVYHQCVTLLLHDT
eukprot:4289354-Karenia_brevis.AAC.1